MDHQSKGLDDCPRDHSGQMDHKSRRPDKSPRRYLDQTDHRYTRLDRNPRVRLGQLDQQDHGKLNSKFSSKGGLTREISIDSQARDQDCDSITLGLISIFAEVPVRH